MISTAKISRIYASALIFACLSANAAPGADEAFGKCMASAPSTIETMDCIDAETTRQDAKLNKAYKKLITSATPSAKAKVQEAQRAWIKMRDADCAYFQELDGGTRGAVNFSDCIMMHTKQRAEYLSTLVD
jgi:uncharacterized protein YecT (DUF1311 family)